MAEDLSRADSLRICGPNPELPRGISNDESYRFGGPWYTPEELETSRDEARHLAMVVPGQTVGVHGAGVGDPRLREGARVMLDTVQGNEEGGVVVVDERREGVRNSVGARSLPRPAAGTVWVVISGGEFFGRTLRAGSMRVELEDLGVADIGVQVITCQRVRTELVEGVLESLCDAWRETLGRRQRDIGRVLADSLGERGGECSCSGR